MKVIKYSKAIISELALCRLKGETVGFVPTMGALHEGHFFFD